LNMRRQTESADLLRLSLTSRDLGRAFCSSDSGKVYPSQDSLGRMSLCLEHEQC
jgi:hypothetical protein